MLFARLYFRTLINKKQEIAYTNLAPGADNHFGRSHRYQCNPPTLQPRETLTLIAAIELLKTISPDLQFPFHE